MSAPSTVDTPQDFTVLNLYSIIYLGYMIMRSSGSILLLALAASISLVNSDPNSICYAYGVDFVDESSYFINSLSAEQFTSVSYFQGCNLGLADVLFVDPDDDEYLCSQLQTTPENEFKMSTCPIRKNQMVSGHWLLLVLGNNGDGQPFAWQRGKIIKPQHNFGH